MDPDLLVKFEKVYRLFLNPICERHGLSKAELDILLFLSNFDELTAAAISKKRFLAKSHVSTAVKGLYEKELVGRHQRNENRKTVFLSITPSAASIIREGRTAQAAFFKSLQKGMTKKESDEFQNGLNKILGNIDRLLEEC